MIVKKNGVYINDETGQIYNLDDWIIHDLRDRITVVKRLSPKQLAFIESMEYRLGYKPINHKNLPAYKAVKLISKLQERLNKPPSGGKPPGESKAASLAYQGYSIGE